MGYLVIDLKNGGLDGWYMHKEMAERAAAAWRKELRHSSVIVVSYDNTEGVDVSIGPCFLSDRRALGELHGPSIKLDRAPPYARSECINKATEVLRDLYDEDIDREQLLVMPGELRSLISKVE